MSIVFTEPVEITIDKISRDANELWSVSANGSIAVIVPDAGKAQLVEYILLRLPGKVLQAVAGAANGLTFQELTERIGRYQV
jgi:hypothetical protein